MIKVKLTENYTGVEIIGDYEDLDELYDAIYYIIKGDPKNEMEESMANHFYGFLYDVRHAYQGDRGVELIENGLAPKRKYDGVKKNITDNVYFKFNYVLPELILHMVLLNYFIPRIDKRELDRFNPYINLVNLFYSKVLHSLSEILTPIRFNKLKNKIMDSVISDTIYYPQWFQNITNDYLKYSKEQRIKEFKKTMDAIHSYYEFIDFTDMKTDILEYCKENDCKISDVYYEGNPDEVEW